ncbi:uncharacterized protein [Patagioenas fasciata]|uniref:uncharacterized protein n=1 Tax=Patagioenas fasciata TaxID=372321 RepID=UPI003A998C27
MRQTRRDGVGERQPPVPLALPRRDEPAETAPAWLPLTELPKPPAAAVTPRGGGERDRAAVTGTESAFPLSCVRLSAAAGGPSRPETAVAAVRAQRSDAGKGFAAAATATQCWITSAGPSHRGASGCRCAVPASAQRTLCRAADFSREIFGGSAGSGAVGQRVFGSENESAEGVSLPKGPINPSAAPSRSGKAPISAHPAPRPPPPAAAAPPAPRPAPRPRPPRPGGARGTGRAQAQTRQPKRALHGSDPASRCSRHAPLLDLSFHRDETPDLEEEASLLLLPALQIPAPASDSPSKQGPKSSTQSQLLLPSGAPHGSGRSR